MTTEQLDSFRNARPFRPFRLHIADGSTFDVKSPEFIWRTPGGRTVFVSQGDDAAAIIDLLLVSHITFTPSRAARRQA